MLKITVTESAKKESWTLCGRLIAPWVDELKQTWKKEHREVKARKCIVNLDEVTFIDKSGERMLRSMLKQGARFVANDLYIKHVLDRVKGRADR
jgi:anti-anti-sigma regulatory factor